MSHPTFGEPWRLVDSDLVTAERSAAIDEAILLAREEGIVPDTLHLYRRDGPTVSLGHFEKAGSCLDMEEIKKLGVRVVRRFSGGSAIYTDPDQLIYTIIVDHRSVPESPQETFRILCGGIIAGLEELGVEAEFKPINDVLVAGRKISGSAQIRKGGVVLQHGTLLVRLDRERMFAVLRSSKRDRSSMTSLAEVLPVPPSMERAKEALVRGFSRTLGCAMERGELTVREQEQVERLVATKYGRSEHTYLR